jgi:C1A family cysteine protease
MPALGRIASPVDMRDHNFLAAAIAPVPSSSLTRKRHFVPPAWDQGSTPQCVAYSGLMLLQAGHVRNKAVAASNAQGFYDACQDVDGFPRPHDGSTIRAAMKVLQAQGYVEEYRWAYTVQDVAQWILTVGPAHLGTVWLNSMFDVTSYRGNKWIAWDANSGLAGGHAYLPFGVDLNKRCPDGATGAFEMQNSWGESWSDKGRAWLSFKVMAALLAEDGEAACPREIVLKAA